MKKPPLDIETTRAALPGRLGQIGSFLSGLRLPRFEDARQKRSLLNILRFAAIVVVFSLVARGTAGATKAKVELTSPAMSEIIEAVHTTGRAETVRSYSPQLPEGITVTETFVVPGQTVNAGDALFALNCDEASEQQQRQTILLKTMQLNLAQLQRGELANSSALLSAQTALDWATKDMSAAKTNGEANIDTAEDNLATARQTLTEAETYYDEAAADPDREPAAKQALEAAKAGLAAAQNALSGAKTAADAANEAAARAEQNARQALATAQQADAQAKQAANDVKAQNDLKAQTLRLDIQQQKALLALFDAIPSDGIVCAQTGGIVLAVGEPGSVTGEGVTLKLSDASGGWRAAAALPAAQAELISGGTQATVAQQGGYYASKPTGSATVLCVSEPDAADMVTVLFALPPGEWKQNQALDIEIEHSRASYQHCVPLSAIHQSQSGYYVLVVAEKNDILGMENIAQVVPVELVAKNGSLAAIEGSFAKGARIVVGASKPVQDGDRVRVKLP